MPTKDQLKYPLNPRKDREAGLAMSEELGPDGKKQRVTKYSPEMALEVCRLVAHGETLTSICKRKEMPSWTTFHRWVVQYPEVGRAYRAARALSAFSLEEEALDLARRLSAGEINKDQIRAIDVALGQLRWSAMKRNPQTFSDKAAVQFVVPIQINTTLDLGDGQQDDSVADHPNIYQIEATVQDTIEVENTPDAPDTPDSTPPLVPRTNTQKKRQEAASKRKTAAK